MILCISQKLRKIHQTIQLKPGAKSRLCFFASMTLISCATHAQNQPIVPPQVLSAKPVPGVAAAAHEERLAILNQEKRELLLRRQKLEKDSDKIALARVEADLQAIDREIALVIRTPALEIKRSVPVQTQTVSAPRGAVNLSQQEGIAYERWDVFKNFGKKEQKQ